MPSARTALLKKAAAEISREIQRAQRPRVDAKFMPDEFQRQVIASTSRLLRVLAPAGSGKTATIVEKALRIVEADRRASVLMLTFTNAGVNAFNAEVQRRAPTLQTRCRANTLNKFGLHAIKSASPDVRSFPHDKPFVAFKTVQGLNNGPRGVPTPDGRFPFTDLWAALEVTKQLGVSPFDGDDEEDQATLEYLDELGPLKVLYAHLERAEVSISPDPESIREFWLPFWREVVEETRRFGLTMEDQKFRAFWDQERSPALRKHIGAKGITHLLVDEFQDTNFLELQLIASIARENRSALYIVGDDDQCIYEWKGCTPVFMTSPDTILPGLLGVEDTFDTVVLERNYRCPRNIVDISRRLIEHNINRVEKEIVAASSDVAHIRHVRLPTSAISMLTLVLLLQQVTQADPKHRFALLARKKAQLVPLQVLLSKHGLDYYIPADCNIFTQDSFGALLDAFELRGAFRSTSGPRLGASRSKDLLRGLADRVWKKALYGPDEGTFNRALYGVTSVHDGLLAIDRAGYLDGKKNDSSVISASIRAFVEADTCAEAMQVLFMVFAGFQQDYGRHKDDIFLRDPPLSLLVDLATSYDVEEEFVADLRRARDRAPMMSGEDEKDDASVLLLTAYRAKGLQFDTVVVLDANDGFWPASQAVQDGRLEEERRLFYVAVTRAKANLLLFNSDYVQGVPRAISPFVTELGLSEDARLAPSVPADVISELLSLYPKLGNRNVKR